MVGSTTLGDGLNSSSLIPWPPSSNNVLVAKTTVVPHIFIMQVE